MSASDPPKRFWPSLDEIEQAALREAGRIKTFRRDMPLCYEGELSSHVMIILSGWAKVTVADPEGRATMIALRGPDEIIGEIGALNQRPRSATVIALQGVTALIIPGTRFSAFLSGHPNAWPKVVGTMALKLSEAGHRISQYSTLQGAPRLAAFILGLAEQYGTEDPEGGIEIPPLSQAELGSCVDSSRETVARAFREWRGRGLIRTGWRKTVLLDLPGLAAIDSP
ncbi:MAG: Crp/Fnr family transcriptional regulator [Streptosporangiaceae bacterium]